MTDIQITGTNLFYIGRGDFTEASNGLLSTIKISESGMDDVDGDNLVYLEESAMGTKTNNYDSDGDDMDDNSEYIYGFNPLVSDGLLDADSDGLSNYVEINLGTDPTHPDSDLDGYKDAAERIFGADPLSANSYPAKVYQYLMIIVTIFAVIGTIVSIMSLIHAFKKDVFVRVYLSYAKEDHDRYKINSITQSLGELKQIEPIIDLINNKKINLNKEMDKNLEMDNNIEINNKLTENTLDNSQIMLFIASDNSMKSEKNIKELEFARKNNIFIVPIKSESIDWPDMAKLQLDRELGVEYKSDNYEGFIEDVKKFINNYQMDFTKLRDALNKNKISFTNLIEREYDLSPEQIVKLAHHLQKGNDIQGAWLKDKKQFLNLKEIKKRFKKMNKFLKTDDIEKLIDKSGIDMDSVEIIKDLLLTTNIKKEGNKK